MLVRILLCCLFVLNLNASDTFTTKRGDVIELEQCPSNEVSVDDQEQIRVIFTESCLSGYRSSGAHANRSDEELREYLNSDFDKMVRPYLFEEPVKVFVGAKLENKLIGYTIFELIGEDAVYVAELGILPEYWRQGLGSKLTFYYVENNPNIQKVFLLMEHINLHAQKFYESIGFTISTYTHAGYTSDRYCAYEKQVR